MPIPVTCPSCQRAFQAPDGAAGKRAKCPKCGGIINIPAPVVQEEILEAEPMRPFTDEDFEVEPPAALPAQDDRRPCPMCGEMIQKNAIKCRHCGEIFDPILKAQASKAAASEGPDADLSVGEWVLAILCSGIGCIVGIVWMIQGKPKGKKMLLISLCVQFLWGIVNVVLHALPQPQ
jgi:predicted RNA-binding Zn-ribbon protein involved in translation (DUF1610 family)